LEPMHGALTEIKDKLFVLVACGENNRQERLCLLEATKVRSLMTMVMAQEVYSQEVDLESEGLFICHVGAFLFKKCIGWRDKKGRICTTLVLSCLLYSMVSTIF